MFRLQMIKFLKYLLLLIVGLLTTFILLSLLLGYMFHSSSRGCMKDSEAADYVRSLSPARFERLYEDMERYSARYDMPLDGYSRHSESGLPAEFQDLEVVRVRPKRKHIMVEGCFDHYLYLHFEIDDEGTRFIEMQYGEHDVGTEVVWKSGET